MSWGQCELKDIKGRGCGKVVANQKSLSFGQLAAMVSEQSEMIQRIDANTYVPPLPIFFFPYSRQMVDSLNREDVVDNVEGAQKELLKYWFLVT